MIICRTQLELFNACEALGEGRGERLVMRVIGLPPERRYVQRGAVPRGRFWIELAAGYNDLGNFIGYDVPERRDRNYPEEGEDACLLCPYGHWKENAIGQLEWECPRLHHFDRDCDRRVTHVAVARMAELFERYGFVWWGAGVDDIDIWYLAGSPDDIPRCESSIEEDYEGCGSHTQFETVSATIPVFRREPIQIFVARRNHE